MDQEHTQAYSRATRQFFSDLMEHRASQVIEMPESTARTMLHEQLSKMNLGWTTTLFPFVTADSSKDTIQGHTTPEGTFMFVLKSPDMNHIRKFNFYGGDGPQQLMMNCDVVDQRDQSRKSLYFVGDGHSLVGEAINGAAHSYFRMASKE